MKNLKTYIEHLQEMGKVVVTDENIQELQQVLSNKGYETEFVSTDRDYLILLNKPGIVVLNNKQFNMETIVNYMDDEIREELHVEFVLADKEGEQEFLDEYCKRHFEKFGEEFDIS